MKKDPICYDSQSISQTIEEATNKRTREDISINDQPNKRKRQSIVAKKVKEEPIDSEIQTEIEVKTEEKFSATKEFANKTSIQTVSIAFLNEETTKSNSQPKNPRNNKKANLLPTENRRYKCNICQKSFSQSNHLVNHQRTHTGEKPYECDICKKTFATTSNLDNHRRIHTGEKPFECGICKKGFAQSSNLDTHLRIHTGEKPYKCEICQKSFTTLSTLNTHLRTHTGEKPYECGICKKSFAQLCGLLYHRRTQHV